MSKKFLKKIIVQSPEDLAVISALCSESKVLQSEIKYLKQNKVFLFPVTRKNDGNNNSKKKIESIIKFEFIENSKSKNIIQDNTDNILDLLAIDVFKKNNNFEIVLLFKKNMAITLFAEIVEVTLEDIRQVDDENY
tara:strand:- start:1692 stop:2099 length:408 start_codon:yes stop_codon:yes gene_type:complete